MKVERRAYKAWEEELVFFCDFDDHILFGPAKLWEEIFFCFLLVAVLLDGNDNTFLINANGCIMEIFQLIQVLAVDKASHKKRLLPGLGCHG